MQAVDWIVIGGGLSGAALGYELARVGFSVRLLEQEAVPHNATRCSYGGIAYWSGTTDLTRQLCAEGIAIHRQLSEELGADTQFREVHLLLTIHADRDAAAIAQSYQQFGIPPVLIDAATACEIEPLLNQSAIAGAMHGQHGHVEPELTVAAYRQAMRRLGGEAQTATVVDLVKQGDRVQGVVTPDATHRATHVVVCAGAMTRSLLRSMGYPVRQYFSHAELVEIPNPEVQLNSLIMPAETQRFVMEATAGAAATDALWDQPGHELTPPILDAGVVQLQNGCVRLGQISRTLTDPQAPIAALESERQMRQGVGHLLPALASPPGQWHRCRVAFSGDRLPLVGALPQIEGLYVFSGFSNPFAFLPPTARRFAQSLAGEPDGLLAQLVPTRFGD